MKVNMVNIIDEETTNTNEQFEQFMKVFDSEAYKMVCAEARRNFRRILEESVVLDLTIDETINALVDEGLAAGIVLGLDA